MATLNYASPAGDWNATHTFVFEDIDFSLPDLDDLAFEMTREDPSGNHVHYHVYNEQQMPQMRSPAFNTPMFDHQTPSSSMQAYASGSGSAATSEREKSPWRAGVGQQPGCQSTVRTGLVEMESGSSQSPEENLMWTPESGYLDYSHGEDQDDVEDVTSNLSPPSPAHSIERDYVLVRQSGVGGRGATFARMNHHRPLPSTTGSGASRTSSVTGPASAVSDTSFQGPQWGSFGQVNPAYMGNHGALNNSDLFSNLGYPFMHGSFAMADQLDDDMFSESNAFDDGQITGLTPLANLRNPGGMVPQDTRIARAPFGQVPRNSNQHHGHYDLVGGQRAHLPYTTAQVSAMNRLATSNHQPQQQTNPRTMPSPQGHGHIMTAHGQQSTHHGRQLLPPNVSQTKAPEPTYLSVPPHMRQKQKTGASYSSTQSRGPAPLMARPIQQAEPTAVVPSSVAVRTVAADNGRRGGRRSQLADDARQKSHRMRKIAACWGCALQRDPCDDGSPCKRCIMRSIKAGHHYFDCDRSKLPDFIYDFLPPSMTMMHQKQSIEDCVKDQVLQWYPQNPIDVYLTSGYGQPLRWKVYEFLPKSNDLLGQLQYLQDPNSGSSRRHNKYSPPFGLQKLDSSDEAHFEDYLEQLMDPVYLWDFGWTCFEEETQIDSDGFQANVLDFLCKLYTDRGARGYNDDLQELLNQILRMIIITYIMGHTLTIVEDTLPVVLNHLRHSDRPDYPVPHTSPKLANRQLKFFFGVLRNNTYERILKWAQQILHTSGKKESSWLPVFCAMLGFAIVLEEVQVTIQIQADAKIAKNEAGPEQAYTEAENACERIDSRFKLMVGIFQCKYRDRKWGDYGSFGPGTPELRDPASVDFLRKLRNLAEEKREHMQTRRDLTCAHQNQCKYTSRLVARFLLPFLDLPGS